MGIKKFTGHLAAAFTIIVWAIGTAATENLLELGLSSAEIILCRFVLSYVLLNIIYPPRLKFESVGRELTYAFAGLCGVTLYFFLESTALKYMSAVNAGVILSLAPLFCGIFSLFSKNSGKPRAVFFVSFIIAAAGIFLIALDEGFTPNFNKTGLICALGAAASWGAYSVLVRQIGSYGHNIIGSSRRIVMYGLIFMVPLLFVSDVTPSHIAMLSSSSVLVNILYLGILASGLCFVLWNRAICTVGAVTTYSYSYAVPVILLIFSWVYLKNQELSWELAAGTVLAAVGLVLSVACGEKKADIRGKKKRKRK
ncbi:MAG: DMT family transporter [Clostridiales bacterium]|nr:DMT family transporter [Clostridiales bacterium]